MKELLLTEICSPKQWKTISAKDLTEGGYPVYGANGKIGYYSNYTHEYPTVLITCRGATCGTINICEPKSYVNGNAMALDNLSPHVHIEYLAYYLKIRGLNDVISGSAQPQITRQNLKKIKIPLPPLETQKKIAEILDAADTLRQKTKTLIEKYDQLTQSLFLEMFGDPVNNPKKWDKKRFEDLVDSDCPLTYGIVQPGEKVIDGIPCVRPVDLTSQFISAKSIKTIDPKISKKYNRTILKGGEILLSVRGSIGAISIARDSLLGANVTRGIVPIWFNKELANKLFFYHLYKTQRIQQQIKELSKGATLIQINLKDLRGIELISPPLHLQNQFAERVQAIEGQKAKAQAALEKSEELFQSLLQRAFKGELV